MTQIPATLTSPRGSMGEEGEPAPELQFVFFTRRMTLEQFHAEFPTLTRTQGAYQPWNKAQGEAS